jgi:signal transduction histidine kinase/AraC-like DNA-binding protein
MRSRQLAMGGLLPVDQACRTLIEPLHFQDEQIGLILFEQKPAGDIYEVLRDEISVTLKAVMLSEQNVHLYQQALAAEKVAQEGRRLAEEADRLKSRFLSMVSHELRTPLVLLVGLSEMMLRERTGDNRPPLPEPYRQDLARIHVSAQQLDSLVRDVLDLTRSQMGELRLVKKPLDLGQVFKAVALIGEEMAHSKGLDWQAEIPPQLPQILGDQARLQQVMLNLVTNAVKFTAHGHVRLQVKVEDNTVMVSVSDTGLGVPVEEQAVIFDEFRQSERTAARGYGGLGLGLSICRQLIEMHGGQIRVLSSGEEDSGSTFGFTLPVASETAPVERTATARAVLLLTEHTGNGQRLREHLVRAGFIVEMLNVGEIKDWLAQVLQSPPGAVVLDLPASERGWEIMQSLKENPATQNVPVLFYSLLQDSGAVLDVDYLSKPLDTTALVRALQQHGLDANTCQAAETVLVVDDDPAILEMHTHLMQAHLPACRVLQATNGRMALDAMRQEHPTLVLLDLMMPELDGFGVVEAMQHDPRLRDIAVVVVTAQRLTQQEMERLSRGVTSILAKGVFSAQETLAHVEQALARSKNLGSETQRIVRKVMAYIHEHYAEPISRQDMATFAGISVRHLTRCFSQEVSMSPAMYLNRYRVNQAKELLRAGDQNITQIADAVGFPDSGYFTRVFRREVGMSPSAYQDQHR